MSNSNDKAIRAVFATEVADGRVYYDVKSRNKVLARKMLDNFVDYLVDEENYALSRSMLLAQFLANNDSTEDHNYVLTNVTANEEAKMLFAPLILENSFSLPSSSASLVEDNVAKYFISEGLKRKEKPCDH